MPRRSGSRSTLALILTLICAACGPDPATSGHLTTCDFAAIAHAAATDFLASQDDAPDSAVMARVRAAIVRVRVGYPDSQMVHGSGVLVADGRYVLTAGHVVAIPEGAEPLQPIVYRYVGEPTDRPDQLRTLRNWCRVVAREHGDGQDWAVLEIIDPAPKMPSLPFGQAVDGPVWVYGFPMQIGVTDAGAAVFTTREICLNPLLMVGRLHEAGSDGMWLEPLAGAQFVGMSGGPVFDRNGAVVAILNGWSRSIEESGYEQHATVDRLIEARAWFDGR